MNWFQPHLQAWWSQLNRRVSSHRNGFGLKWLNDNRNFSEELLSFNSGNGSNNIFGSSVTGGSNNSSGIMSRIFQETRRRSAAMVQMKRHSSSAAAAAGNLFYMDSNSGERSPFKTASEGLPKSTSTNGNNGISKSFFLKLPKPFTVLGIETSCDDTGVAIVNSDGVIIGETLCSQQDAHEQYSGIVPGLAVRYHANNLPGAIKSTLEKANMSITEVDAIAVTRGPGLAPCLTVGLSAAKTLAMALNKPIVGVHHMEAHALTARLVSKPRIEFPFLSLLISGGHTLLVLVKSPTEFEQLGTTLDDSIGEAFDKVARFLRLPWLPGITGGAGAAVEKAAKSGNPYKFKFTVPMLHKSTCDFSFSGLKTAVKNKVEEAGFTDITIVNDIAASFQNTALDHIENKLARAYQMCVDENIEITSLVVSGGVACNMAVRDRMLNFAQSKQLSCTFPPPRLCRDNGVMIAWAGIERLQLGIFDDPVGMGYVVPWPLGQTAEQTLRAQSAASQYPPTSSLYQDFTP